MNRLRNFSRTSWIVFSLIFAGLIIAGLVAFFTSEVGRTIALVCCGGLVLVVVVALVSERGMARRF
ncbi:MAG: hypothetical protein KME04_07560 [Pleurocapsa minor GSE-CHR-MK-17-07R]|jgi:cytochrome c oxidase subunit IV|nr:hypothetical protein [Pleurocapsa minor GSE-CHR-MK 17-07R]